MNVGIYWDEQTKTASIKSSGWRGERELKFQSDSNTAAINGEKITLAVPVQIVNGRTMVPASAIAEGLDLAVTWDEKTQSLSLQERYRSQNGAAEIVLTPIKPDKDSSYMIYRGMQAEINGEKYEYAWEWNVGIGQYIVYNPPEIFWADLNADGREEIIIRLVDGINTGTGVSWEKVYVLKPNGAEIAVQDAREYALSLAEKKEGYCVCTVSDNGVGMDSRQISALNRQQDISSTCDPSVGSEHGLGLKLARQIVKAHRGILQFGQNSPSGLTVTIFLPSADTAPLS